MPWVLAGGANAGREHEVEGLRLGDFVASLRINNLVVAAQLTQFGPRVVVNLFRRDKSREAR